MNVELWAAFGKSLEKKFEMSCSFGYFSFL